MSDYNPNQGYSAPPPSTGLAIGSLVVGIIALLLSLIPVIGWLIQKGRCHFCHASIGCYSTFSELINGWLWYELFILDPKIITALLILSTSLLVCSATDYFAQWIWPIWLIGLFSLFWLLNQSY